MGKSRQRGKDRGRREKKEGRVCEMVSIMEICPERASCSLVYFVSLTVGIMRRRMTDASHSARCW